MANPVQQYRKSLLTFLGVMLAACAVNPVTGKKELSLVSTEQEIAIGAENYGPSQQAQGGRYYLDPEVQVYVAEVGRKLAAVSDRPELPYDFVVLNNPVPNAWAMPGGKIAVNSGLLTHLNNEAELAAVLGHEIVHAAARHSAAQMSRGALIGLGAQVLAVAGSSYGLGQLAGTAAQAGSAAWMARYGREDELEADYYGMEYMSRAGYDPQGAVTLQKTFVKLSEGREQDFFSALFASHPPSQDRVDANRARANTLPAGGSSNREHYLKKTAQLRHDAPAYKAQEEAVKALNNKDGKAALAQLDKAVEIQPRDGYTWELRGHAWKVLDDDANAEKAFTTAIGKNPDYFAPYLYRGALRFEQKKFNGAKADLQKSQQLLPTQAASYFLGGIALQEGDRQSAIKYLQSAAQGNNEMAKKAQGELAVLELEQNPAKYIPSGLSLSRDGYLLVTVQNNSPVTVTGIVLQVTKMQNAFVLGQGYTLNGPDRLDSGTRTTIKTGIGPFASAAEAGGYSVAVIKAKIAE